MFTDIQVKVENFVDLETAEQENLLKEIEWKARNNREGFRKYMSSLNYGLDSPRCYFYEAIWGNPQGWEDWLYHEQMQLIMKAEMGDEDAIHEMSSLFYLTKVENMPKAFYQKVLDLMAIKLNSNEPTVREHCAESMLDINDIGNIDFTKEQIKALQQLLKDIVFSIRIKTYADLKEMNLLPHGFKLSTMDKMRAKLTGKGDLV